MTERRIGQVFAMMATMLTLGAGAAAQTLTPAATMEELLKEVRGLRAELAQATGAGMRMQLLVARLTLQEQRITSLGRQSSEIQKQLLALVQDRAQSELVLKQMLATTPPPDPADAADLRDSFDPLTVLKLKIAQSRQQELLLQGQEAELASAINAEQGRWSEFNARLEELERSIVGSTRQP